MSEQPIDTPVSVEDWPAVIDALWQVSARVKTRFMPAVFSCECGGAEESCRRALDDPRVWQARETVEGISTWILDFARELDDKWAATDETTQVHGDGTPRRIQQLNDTINAIRDLHQADGDGITYCVACTKPGYYVTHPCPTIQLVNQ